MLPHLKSDFIHVFFVDGGLGPANKPVAALTVSKSTVREQNGVLFSTSETKRLFDSVAGITKYDEAFASTLAHEITHVLINPVPKGVWDTHEHHLWNPINDPDNRFSRDLMGVPPNVRNSELATIDFESETQKELMTKTNDGLAP